jgi:3-oxoacyl-[acyl-carrier protein] reductase
MSYIKKDLVVITGSSKGIGKETALKFLKEGFDVIGLDKEKCPFELSSHENYKHITVDVSDKSALPEIDNVNILINNAGEQGGKDDIKTNLYSAIYVTEKYGIQENIKAILFNASVSAHTGFEFPEYVASKGGLLPYMKNVACRVAKYGATCNSISCGGVLTELNKPVIEDKELWNKIMSVTPLKRWAEPEEIADWIYFITVNNKFMSGQDIIIDGGEKDLNNTFIWPETK